MTITRRALSIALFVVLTTTLLISLIADSPRNPAELRSEGLGMPKTSVAFSSHEAGGGESSSNEGKPRHSNIPRKCRNKEVLKGHVDSDRNPDFVYHDYLKSGPTLGVCTGSGKSDRIPGSGQTELLTLIDVEPDGRHEIFFGGTTVSASAYDVAVFRRGRMVKVRTSKEAARNPYDDFFVAQGEGLSPLRSHKRPIGSAFGCQNTSGRRASELVRSAVFRAGEDKFGWLKVSHRLEGTKASLVAKKRGIFPNNSAKKDRIEVVELASTLVSPCTHSKGS